MDNAVANPAVTPLVPLNAAAANAQARPGLGERWAALPGRVQLMAMLGIAALLAVLAVMAMTARESDWRPLTPQPLPDKETAAVVDRLVQMNVPYKMAAGGTTILVPAAQLSELRVKLAAANVKLGDGSTTQGYELLDQSRFGQTQTEEHARLRRAIEGELARSLQALEPVKSVRLHLAMPQQHGFFREQQRPSASVVLTLHPGRTLDRSQIAGIQHIVARAVPDMRAVDVVVNDSSGAMLSQPPEEEGGLSTAQLQYRREIEAGHARRVMALLEPVLGRENVRATVSAEIDFSQVMQTAEVHAPNQGEQAKATIREQRSEESSQPGPATPAGVPGATSNQAPVPAQAPVNGPAQALQGAGGAAAGASAQRREAATRFEVDKTVTVTKGAVGQVRRLSAAVVINHKTSTDARGRTTTAPLSDKEVEQITALVQQGIGFDAQRGDVVKVVNVPFRKEVAEPLEPPPVWQQPWLTELAKTAIAPLALALVALFVVLKLIKPAVAQMFAPPPAPEPGAQLSEVVDDGPGERSAPALPAPPNEKLESARRMAKDNPAAVANIVRGWVNGGTTA